MSPILFITWMPIKLFSYYFSVIYCLFTFNFSVLQQNLVWYSSLSDSNLNNDFSPSPLISKLFKHFAVKVYIINNKLKLNFNKTRSVLFGHRLFVIRNFYCSYCVLVLEKCIYLYLGYISRNSLKLQLFVSKYKYTCFLFLFQTFLLCNWECFRTLFVFQWSLYMYIFKSSTLTIF